MYPFIHIVTIDESILSRSLRDKVWLIIGIDIFQIILDPRDECLVRHRLGEEEWGLFSAIKGTES